MTISLPEVFISHAALASYVSKELKKGRLRKLGSRVYTSNLKEPMEVLTKRHAWFIVKELFPGSVIVDRTALEHRLAADGSIFIVSKKKEQLFFPDWQFILEKVAVLSIRIDHLWKLCICLALPVLTWKIYVVEDVVVGRSLELFLVKNWKRN